MVSAWRNFQKNYCGIYTTIGIVRCTLGVATDDLAVKTKVYLNESVANALHDNMGMGIFDR